MISFSKDPIPKAGFAVDLKTLNDEQITRRYRRFFAIGSFIIILLAFPAAFHSSLAIKNLFNRPSDWIPEDQPVRIEYDDFSRRFSVADLVLVSWDGAELGSEPLADITRLLQPLTVDSTNLQTQSTEGEKPPIADVDDEASKIVSKLLAELGEHPLHWVRNGTEILDQMTGPPASLPRAAAIKRLSGSIVGPDEKQTCIVISLTERGLQKRRVTLAAIRSALSERLGSEPSKISMAGGPYDGMLIDEASIRSVQTFAPPSTILGALLCFFCLRSFALTAAITVIAVVGEGLVLAAVYYSGEPMNAVLIVLPPLVFVLTVSSGIHLSNYYLDALQEHPEATRAQAAAIAMDAGTLPCLMAASTTVVGLGSLMLVRLAPIQIFGAVATMGLLATLALLLLIMPGAMLLYGGPRVVTERDLLFGPNSDRSRSGVWRQLRIVARRLFRYPVAIISCFGLITVALGSGLAKLDTSVNVPRMFDPSHPLRTQYEWFEANIGPTINGELLLRFPADQTGDDPIDRFELVREAHVATARAKDIGGVLSAVSFVPPVSRGRGLSATASRSVIRSQLIDPQSPVGKLGYISRDEQAEVWRISFRLPMTTKSDYGPEIDAVGKAVSKAIAEAAQKQATGAVLPQVVLTGGVKVAQEAQGILLHDLFLSFLSAFAVVAVVMMLLLRNIVGGLLAMVPNIFPTIALFGYMGLTNLPLDIGSVMTASVALGIAVDDTIHLLSRFSSRTAKGVSRRHAALGALQQCGMAMVHTTMVCGLSLLVYAGSEFIPTRRFAFLMFSLLFVALLSDLLFLPALMISRLGVFLSKPLLAAPDPVFSDNCEDALHVDARSLPMTNSTGNGDTVY